MFKIPRVVADVRVISLPKKHSSKSPRTTRQCAPILTTSAVITNFQLTRTSPCCRHLLSLPLSSFSTVSSSTRPYKDRLPASPSRVSASFSASMHVFCTSCERVAKNSLSLAEIGLITWLSIGAVGNSFVVLLWDTLFSPHACFLTPVPVVLVRENTPRPEPQVCGCGAAYCARTPAPLEIQWSEAASEGTAVFDSLQLQSNFDHCQRASGSFDNLGECGMARSCDTRAMAVAACSHRARDRGGIAQLGSAGNLRSRGSEWRRACEWPGQAEFPNVVRLIELDCCSSPLTAAGGVGIFAVLVGPAYSFVSPGCCKRRMWRQFELSGCKSLRSPKRQHSVLLQAGIAAPLPKSQCQATPTPSQFRSFDVGNARCLAKVGKSGTARS